MHFLAAATYSGATYSPKITVLVPRDIGKQGYISLVLEVKWNLQVRSPDRMSASLLSPNAQRGTVVVPEAGTFQWVHTEVGRTATRNYMEKLLLGTDFCLCEQNNWQPTCKRWELMFMFCHHSTFSWGHWKRDKKAEWCVLLCELLFL